MIAGRDAACWAFLVINCILFLSMVSKYNDLNSPSTSRIFAQSEAIPVCPPQKEVTCPPVEKVVTPAQPVMPINVKTTNEARLDINRTTNVLKCSSSNNSTINDFSKREPVSNWGYTWLNDTEANQYGCKGVELLDWALTLRSKEKKIYSQNGEDGVLIEIFEKIGTKDKFYVEFGTEEGMECNTRVFRENYGWKGALFDRLKSNPAIGLHQASMWIDTVVGKFKEFNIPMAFDLLSVDTDFGDFWLLREILLAGYRPRVVIVEVNVALGPYASFTIPVKAAQDHIIFLQNRWFGATVLAFSKLMHKFGYQLLYVEKLVVNAVFIKSSEINNVDLARVAWQRQLFDGLNNKISHVNDPENRAFVHICEESPCESSDDW